MKEDVGVNESTWNESNTLSRSFSFRTYSQVIDFVNRVFLKAEEKNHHPEMHVRYNEVYVLLTTHESGEVTERDRMLAKEIEVVYISVIENQAGMV
jgi:4a-hydroxytetrahydrobiopterin dehydratase